MTKKKDAEEEKAENTVEEADTEPAEETAEAAEENEEAEETQEVEDKGKAKKTKRLFRIKKSKKDKENPLSTAIRLVVDSGKFEFGYRRASKNAILGKSKAFVLARFAPQKMREEIEKYSKASSIPVIEFEGSSLELGSACGKPFSISVLSIYEEGSSNILQIAKKK